MKKILVVAAVLLLVLVGYFCVGLLSAVHKWDVVKEDLPHASSSILLRAELGEPNAQIAMGMLYELGGALNSDKKEYYYKNALYWYERASWKVDRAEKYQQILQKEYDALDD